jgi:hypothetical protein
LPGCRGCIDEQIRAGVSESQAVRMSQFPVEELVAKGNRWLCRRHDGVTR